MYPDRANVLHAAMHMEPKGRLLFVCAGLWKKINAQNLLSEICWLCC